MSSEIITHCGKAIADKGWEIAFAETASAGKLSTEFSLTPHLGKIQVYPIILNLIKS